MTDCVDCIASIASGREASETRRPARPRRRPSRAGAGVEEVGVGRPHRRRGVHRLVQPGHDGLGVTAVGPASGSRCPDRDAELVRGGGGHPDLDEARVRRAGGVPGRHARLDPRTHRTTGSVVVGVPTCTSRVASRSSSSRAVSGGSAPGHDGPVTACTGSAATSPCRRGVRDQGRRVVERAGRPSAPTPPPEPSAARSATTSAAGPRPGRPAARPRRRSAARAGGPPAR